MKETFGSYITKMRERKGIGLRELGRQIGISSEHLCNIEKDRRVAPPYRNQLEIAKALQLTKEESETLFDLAIKTKQIPDNVSGDIVDYINGNTNVIKALRMARDKSISGERWIEFINQIKF